jgi:hypothetical protein
MHGVVTGTITSADISVMGKLKYGYLGIDTNEKGHIKVKVTAFTKFDTLDVGSRVTVELESVGDSELPSAKTISIPN